MTYLVILETYAHKIHQKIDASLQHIWKYFNTKQISMRISANIYIDDDDDFMYQMNVCDLDLSTVVQNTYLDSQGLQLKGFAEKMEGMYRFDIL